VSGASRATCLAPCAARTQHVDQQRNDHLGAADAKEAAENADAKPGDDVRRQRYTPRMPYRATRVSASNGPAVHQQLSRCDRKLWVEPGPWQKSERPHMAEAVVDPNS
jgi:hypothetical protein